MKCRSCNGSCDLILTLGLSPVANHYPAPGEVSPRYPLRLFVCPDCSLVQVEDMLPREAHFGTDYAYRSGASSSWRAHLQAYAERITRDMALSGESTVIEIGGNDGALVEAFYNEQVHVINIDPCAEGPLDIKAFFGRDLALSLPPADLMIANNVLAHVPDLNDFIAGFAVMLKPFGLATFEFPLACKMFETGQYDMIYHEHYSYLSVLALRPLFWRHGLEIVDVERLTTHGGSARIHVRHMGVTIPSERVEALIFEERSIGTFGFSERVAGNRYALRTFLSGLKAQGLSIAAYGAPAKATTLLNHCEIDRTTITYTVDKAESKQGRMIPGTDIPIFPVDYLRDNLPDVVLILAWNLAGEIAGILDDLPVRLAVSGPIPGFIGEHVRPLHEELSS